MLRAEEGALYPALHRMEEAGWIRARWITKETGRQARIYELTAARVGCPSKENLAGRGRSYWYFSAAIHEETQVGSEDVGCILPLISRQNNDELGPIYTEFAGSEAEP